ncbi:hypothetical protein B0F90DRAFT_1758208 [Multifurca ochricompacta]|uniref:NFX1-type zinc finger-containing protein 1 n=1 Tax=Multifurca ochricompacta TaxID=376703 RepID=A0AAD4QH59_9AGAM|nr:hypothetical protein B0F90DRAFT_1758208 [Multifurca ochricompacta]
MSSTPDTSNGRRKRGRGRGGPGRGGPQVHGSSSDGSTSRDRGGTAFRGRGGPGRGGPQVHGSSSDGSTSRDRGGTAFRGRGGSASRGRGGTASHDSGSTASHDHDSGGTASRDRGGTPPHVRATVPGGVCTLYWSTGSCDRSFECRFKHQVKPQVDVSSSRPQPGDYDPDFFSVDGLAMNNGSIADPQHNLRPNEAHNYLKPYLVDNFVFRDAINVEGFSRIFASINSRNQEWVRAQASLAFLDTVVRGNALLRIGDVLRFTPIAANTGAMSSTLSYQKGYFPILEFFSSDLVLKTTMHENTNKIYSLLDQNYDAFHTITNSCMTSMIDAQTWQDLSPGLPASRRNTLDGVHVFKALSTLLSQYLARFKSAIKNHPELRDLVEHLFSWFNRWNTAVSESPASFDDPIVRSNTAIRKLTLAELEKDINRLKSIVDREHGHAESVRQPLARAGVTAGQKQQALIARLKNIYDPPGTLRNGGIPRHDNDSSDIRDIRIAPTHAELLCPIQPYLPVVLPEAPHHLPENSMQRHLDIQFRLLREELIASVRLSLEEIHKDLDTMWAAKTRSKKNPTKLEKLIISKGGTYRTSGMNSVFFHLYTGARFAPVKAERRSFTIGLMLDAPPGSARDKSGKNRAEYWERAKRLQNGNLVALILISPGRSQVFLGTVASTGGDIGESSKADGNTIQLRVSFFDPEIELMALHQQPITVSQTTYALLMDNSTLFESMNPFLRTLQNVEPTLIPFSHIITHSQSLGPLPIEPPRYARVPQFKYNLQCLARVGQNIASLDANSVTSKELARQELRRASNLDPSQIDAVLDTLTREVSLIQGPPGTGKSFTGKEILRVLFSSKIRPIVLIAFTNHALDHMLTSILDANITTKVVRLGSRATDERIAEYSLYKLERLSGRGDLDRQMRRQYGNMKDVEDEITRIMNRIQSPQLSSEAANTFLDLSYGQHADYLREPPFWIAELFRQVTEDEKENGEWAQVPKGRGKGKRKKDFESPGLYGFWKDGRDIKFIQPPPTPRKSRGESSVDPRVAFFDGLGFSGQIPPVPSGSRSLEHLKQEVHDVWSMSLSERNRLAESWEEDMRTHAYDSNLGEYTHLRKEYRDVCEAYESMQDESRRRLLDQTDLIACTTTGAAKLVSLLASIAPKVLMVEEAGQVLEAHILATLVPSVEHLICIGDPLQLRPTLANFALSMESTSGRDLYKFDRSLMERLSDAGVSMSQINIQRRMRPSISHFIRTILYPKLEDHDFVHSYPPVQGMQKNVFFFSHNNRENAEDDSVSKFNMFEVEMIRELVLYFLKQGPYDGAGDIAVLCAYLGQLQKVRAALRDLKIAVSVDERDEEQLERTGLTGDDSVGFTQVQVARHIRLGTVDTFQGEEAKIVIISLVRNSGSFEHGNGSIGFLKSPNRINVALSRAKHGLYILGNASNLRGNQTWRTILDEMENEGHIGNAIPIVCSRHPSVVQSISKLGELPTLAPEGGCLRQCEFRLACGHVCPSMCHTDRDNHLSMKCNHACLRVTCPRSHPCPLLCFQDCGECKFPVYDVKLPCGHTAKSVPWQIASDTPALSSHMLNKLESIKCIVQVLKRLPGCEHSAMMGCGQDRAKFTCKEICGGLMTCCSRTCPSRCHECQSVTQGQAGAVRITSGHSARTHHLSHPCQRLLKCQHLCGLPCSSDHSCNPQCAGSCRQRCSHRKCEKPCWEPCPPCMEPCEWRCPHQSCPVVCGSICSRLPCDRACRKELKCGHECPSICGEPCEKQICIVCLPDESKVDIVDFIMQRTLAEIDLTSDDSSERVIRLECGHIFTVETLDGHCNMSEYYEAPPVDFQTPPACPTCRGPISALRYGRVTKRANLDILEQNVASTMSSALEQVSPAIEEFSAKLEAIPFSPPPEKDAEDLDHLVERRETHFGKEFEPLPHKAIQQGSMTAIHGLSKEEGQNWNKIVCDLLKLYKKVADVARTRGPHVQAYGAALATLYRLELAAIASDPERACDKPEPLAMKEVNKKIGQPPHKADTRFQVEGFLLSLELRYTLAEIAQSRIASLSTASREEEILRHASLWRSFVSFIYDSCIRDAEKARTIAEKSSASRLAARASVYVFRGELELFRFEILTTRTLLARGGGLDSDHRKELSSQAEQQAHMAAIGVQRLETRYIRSRPTMNMEELKAERAWFAQNCRERVDKYVREYSALAKHLLTDKGYEPLSLQEKADIVKAFGFSHRGHFYNCANGHTFVITECGGAMESAVCPECRAPIGGSNHHLVGSNTRAMEFEVIARQQGSLDAHWEWGRGA